MSKTKQADLATALSGESKFKLGEIVRNADPFEQKAIGGTWVAEIVKITRIPKKHLANTLAPDGFCYLTAGYWSHQPMNGKPKARQLYCTHFEEVK